MRKIDIEVALHRSVPETRTGQHRALSITVVAEPSRRVEQSLMHAKSYLHCTSFTAGAIGVEDAVAAVAILANTVEAAICVEAPGFQVAHRRCERALVDICMCKGWVGQPSVGICMQLNPEQ